MLRPNSLCVAALLSLCSLSFAACEPLAVGPVSAQEAHKEKHLAVTGAAQGLERLTSDPVTELHPSISPDGKVLLFEVRVYESETSDALKQQTLVAVNPETRAQRTLYTSDRSMADHPAWLPDQSSFIFTSNSPGEWSLVRALTASPQAAVNVIAAGEIAPEASWPAVSPDGKRAAFSTTIRGQKMIAIIDLDGSHLVLLGEGVTPSWSPDGAALAFSRTVNNHDHLFLVNPASGTDLVQLTSGDFDHSTPSWSPDGKYIVFSTNRAAKKGEKITNLYILNRDGTGLTQLTEGDSLTQAPDWGRDGWIYFASNQSGNFDIWRLRPAGDYADLKSARVALPPPPVQPPPAASSASAPPAPPPTSVTSVPPPVAPPPAAGGCVKDTDCKGNRICDAGKCTAPKAPGK